MPASVYRTVRLSHLGVRELTGVREEETMPTRTKELGRLGRLVQQWRDEQVGEVSDARIAYAIGVTR